MSADPGLERIAVVGLGYVGLPLAVAFARAGHAVVGYDVDPGRIAELTAGRDRTGEVDPADLAAARIAYAADPACVAAAEVAIVTVPTPVTADRRPDLGPLSRACLAIAPHLAAGVTAVFESTVYPGVTRNACAPLLEQGSGLKLGAGLALGYSPERINPGDRTRRLEHIVKVVAGDTPETAARLARLYGRIVPAGIHVAPSIEVAEAAKVIENAQRDVNIAFINEVALIFGRVGLSIHDVLAAARTKWNFLDFRPGLVGGHCIGVDPYYLAELAERVGVEPAMTLSGRRTNDAMAFAVADRIDAALPRGARTLILGLTFKENVPDLRNSKVRDLAMSLAAKGHRVALHDPQAAPADVARVFGQAPVPTPEAGAPWDAVVAAVPHQAYLSAAPGPPALVRPGGLFADVKGAWRGAVLPDGASYWSL